MNKQPIVGDILHYHTLERGPAPAIVTGVNGVGADLHVFGHGRPGFDRADVWFWPMDVEEPPDAVTSWCEWPPREEAPAPSPGGHIPVSRGSSPS